MSLDVYLTATVPTCVFDANITHNLGLMADAAGIYKHVWRPEEVGVKTAADMIEPLRAGITLMENNPKRFMAFDADNGWGLYDQFVPWLKKYLAACEENPTATVEVSR